jgi:hypothetical protein
MVRKKEKNWSDKELKRAKKKRKDQKVSPVSMYKKAVTK